MKLKIPIYVFIIPVGLAAFAYLAFDFQTERFMDKESIVFSSEVFPKFNPKVVDYGTYKCDENDSSIKLDPKLSGEISKSGLVTKITFPYFGIFKKNYYLTCVDQRVSPISITNEEGKRNEFN